MAIRGSQGVKGDFGDIVEGIGYLGCEWGLGVLQVSTSVCGHVRQVRSAPCEPEDPAGGRGAGVVAAPSISRVPENGGATQSQAHLRRRQTARTLGINAVSSLQSSAKSLDSCARMLLDGAKKMKITSVEFRNYKGLKHFSVALQAMNVLVGPNNCGKSTIIDAFKILSVALRRARARRPDIVMGPKGRTYGHELAADILAVSLENSHTDYADTETTILFRISNGNHLQLYFPKDGGCRLLAIPQGKAISTAAAFKSEYPISVAIVPVLGRVEHEETLVQKETVQRNIETHLASRHFRNYWHHFPEDFGEFSSLIAATWPTMEILAPEVVHGRAPRLSMFCLENRITRELFWAGSGFQIWCQLLTHIVAGRGSTLLVVDEPEIYLHPDVQRQLVSILRRSGSDVLLASHSPEIIGEADPSEILLIDKRNRSGQRLRDAEGVQCALDRIGSSQNITLTRLARNRRILFVENEQDINLIRRFARQVGFIQLAAGTDITAVSSKGFSSWEKVEALGWGIPLTLGADLVIGAIYDRDYWCAEEIEDVLMRLRSQIAFAAIHSRKEIENYLLVPIALTKAIAAAVTDRLERGAAVLPAPPTEPEMEAMLDEITTPLRAEVQSQYIARRQDFFRRSRSGLDPASVAHRAIEVVDTKWKTISTRMEIVPGKAVLGLLRDRIQLEYGVSLSDQRIVGAFRPADIPSDLRYLLECLDRFRQATPNTAAVSRDENA